MIILILDNHGFASIGGLSESVGCAGFATEYRYAVRERAPRRRCAAVDLAANAASLGRTATRACTPDAVREGDREARHADRTTAIVDTGRSRAAGRRFRVVVGWTRSPRCRRLRSVQTAPAGRRVLAPRSAATVTDPGSALKENFA